ncbi:MAG: flagellar hook-associated protein FlgK [Thermoguttaceae bacterium]|nr:flagellar hook-associated protein FlgK [Thermoguttaceae bacterium]
MSVYGSIRLAANTLRANQIAMQVVGQNLANANTEGYIREEVVLSPAPTQRMGGLLLGMGVEVEAVIQKIDNFLEERLRGSVSERSSNSVKEDAYLQLETMINELGDTDLSTRLNDFFSAVSEVLNQPESVSVRNLAVLQAATLANDMNRLSERVQSLRSDLNDRVTAMADRINRLIEEIRTLNVRITQTEGGDISKSDAVGLRDQRLKALENLAELIEIRVTEQTSGSVVVYAGGDFLVYDGVSRPVEVVLDNDRGLTIADLQISETDSVLGTAGGELRGLTAARDEILGGFLDRLDSFAQTLVFEFNKIYSSGQGLQGFEQLTSEFSVDDIDLPLNSAGLKYTPTNGSFKVLVRSKATGLTETDEILVDLNGLGRELTLAGLAQKLEAVDGIHARTTSYGNLEIWAESADQEFAFAADTSGVLASLGVNTFFSGWSARSMGVNQAVKDNPALFAASQGGIGADTKNAVVLAQFYDYPLESKGRTTLEILYDRLMGETTQGSTVARAMAEGARIFEQTLRGQKLATSGVAVDEETIRLMAYQRSFQASARYIKVLEELLATIVSL